MLWTRNKRNSHEDFSKIIIRVSNWWIDIERYDPKGIFRTQVSKNYTSRITRSENSSILISRFNRQRYIPGDVTSRQVGYATERIQEFDTRAISRRRDNGSSPHPSLFRPRLES